MARSFGLFSAQYLPHMGGVERYTDNLAGALASRGHRVTVVTSSFPGCPPRETTPQGVEVVRLSSLSLMGGRLPVLLPWGKPKTLPGEPFDMAVVNTRLYPLSLFGVKRARRAGTPCIVVEHGSAHLTLGNRFADRLIHAYEHAITGRILRASPAFYGVSQAACEWLSHFGIRTKGVLANAVDFDEIARLRSITRPHFRRDAGLNRDTPTIVYTGRLIPEKGVWQLTQAVEHLARSQNIHLFLAGDGPLEKSLREREGRNLSVLGKLDFPEVITLLSECDIFCLPSRSEGFCSSYLEAVACRCFAVGTAVGILGEVFHSGDCGEELEDMSEMAIEKGLKKALARQDRRECAERAYAYCSRRFTFAQTAMALEQLVLAREEDSV